MAIQPGDRVTILEGVRVTCREVTFPNPRQFRTTVTKVEGSRMYWRSNKGPSGVELNDLPEVSGWPRLSTAKIQKLIQGQVSLIREDLREDAIQDIWIKVLEVLDQFDPRLGREKKWLTIVIQNAVVDWLRVQEYRYSQGGDREVQEDDLIEASEPVGLGLLLDLEMPGATERSRKVQKHIVRRMIEGWTAKEAGKELGISSQAAHKHLEQFRDRFAA